jgi:head-tail adaptor
MRLGLLNTHCRVERQETDLGLGLPRKWKATGKKLWISVEQLSGSEALVAQQREGRANLKHETHWQPDILVGDRLVSDDGRIFNIVTANNVGNQNRELVLTSIEVVK